MIVGKVQRLDARHGAVEFLDVGTGLPILYFHGTGAAADAALLLEKTLLQSGCRLVIPNRPGYYGTTVGVVGCTKYCADLAADVLDHLAIERVAAIGTSGGGMPAAAFASRHPERTAALILQCGQSHQWDRGRWLPHGLGRALFLFRNPLFRPLLRWQNAQYAKKGFQNPISLLRRMSGSRFRELCDHVDVVQQISELSNMTLRCAAEPAGIQNDWAIMVGRNGVAKDTIECPTLIIHDQADPLVPFAHAERSQSCIPRARLLDIHAGGHLIWFGKESAMAHDQRMTFLRESLANGK
jgi:pimeloyl-ACP methyl ester carboxylesterase